MFSTGIVLLCFDKSIQKATPVTQNDEWLEIKMPIALPYSSDFANITSHEGLIEYQGEFYNIIEQRYSNDTLYTNLKLNQYADGNSRKKTATGKESASLACCLLPERVS